MKVVIDPSKTPLVPSQAIRNGPKPQDGVTAMCLAWLAASHDPAIPGPVLIEMARIFTIDEGMNYVSVLPERVEDYFFRVLPLGENARERLRDAWVALVDRSEDEYTRACWIEFLGVLRKIRTQHDAMWAEGEATLGDAMDVTTDPWPYERRMRTQSEEPA